MWKSIGLSCGWLLIASSCGEPSALPAQRIPVEDAGAVAGDSDDEHDGDPRDASVDSGADAMASAMDNAGCTYVAKPAQGRELGVDILDVAMGESFEDNLVRLAELHGTYLTLHLPWTAIEVTPGAGTTTGTLLDPGTPAVLATFDALASSAGLKLSLTLRPVDATGKTVPADLAALDFDDPTLVARFVKVVDFVLTKIAPEHLVNLMLGNEVDVFNPGADADFWPEYAQFLASVRGALHTKYPTLPVGFTTTLPSWTDATRTTADGWPAQQVLQTWASQVDVVGVTYYPLNTDFTMRPPESAAPDIAALVAAVPVGKPIHVQEIGYASSSVNGSSDEQQARFFCEALHAWDAHAGRIPLLALLRMNDVSESKAGELAGPYGLGTPAFKEYLRTLGLRTALGETKPAFELVRAQTAASRF